MSLPSFPPAGVSASAANLSSPITPQLSAPSSNAYSGPFGASFTLSAWVNPLSRSSSPMTILWVSANVTSNASVLSYSSSAGNATSQLQLYLTPSSSSPGSGPFVGFSWVATNSSTPWPAAPAATAVSLTDSSTSLSLNGEVCLISRLLLAAKFGSAAVSKTPFPAHLRFLVLTAWSHIALVAASNGSRAAWNLSIYVNGSLVAVSLLQGTVNGSAIQAPMPDLALPLAYLGQGWNLTSPMSPFNGYLAEVRSFLCARIRFPVLIEA